MWLRDHCREEHSIRLSTESAFESSYSSFYPWSFLIEHAYNPSLVRQEQLPGANDHKIYWDKSIASDPPMVNYEQVMTTEEGVWEWLKRIDTYGFCLVSGIPGTPEATEALIRRIAFIRETHYGGFWDFTANLEHGDLAYSEVRLEAHTDTTYFTDPCGLQLFHLLSPSTTHTGGHNLLVDGFRAARVLQDQHPEHYDLLSNLPIPSHASGSGSASMPSGVHMRPLRKYPVFNHDENGQLVMVRWNGDDRGVVGGGGGAFEGETMDRWYDALRTWEGILRSDEAQLWSKMEVGTAVIFDNLRVLHGRSAFSGSRRLCGAYVNGDDYRSRLRGLQRQFGGGDPRLAALRAQIKERWGLAGRSEPSEAGSKAWEGYL
ncbi:hypothetical protein B0A53_01691 [Rhodotorula sp. CCFEE 5036]|nr:hypothetical protein B0A53_01691 [Rhodotorula sp. CCFEE 5036]